MKKNVKHLPRRISAKELDDFVNEEIAGAVKFYNLTKKNVKFDRNDCDIYCKYYNGTESEFCNLFLKGVDPGNKRCRQCKTYFGK